MIALLFITLIAVLRAEHVTFHLNECIGDLVLKNYHNYTGKVLAEPPSTVSKGSSVEIFKFEYAKIALFGSMLDANLNYYQSGTTHILLHGFFNVNKTGGIYMDIESHFDFGAEYCTDIALNEGKLPSVVGVYTWTLKNGTLDECKEETGKIKDCTHFYKTK